MRLKRFLFILILFMPHMSFATNLGVVGQVYPILETDLLQEIKERLLSWQQAGILEKKAYELQERAATAALYPKPVALVLPAEKNKTWLMNPSIRLSQDIYDDKKNLLWKKGTVLNPLQLHPLHETLLFLNEEDKAQVKWAENEILHASQPVKPILVQGNWSRLMQKWQRPVYFDQRGKLSSHFNVTHVPAKITQQGDRLKIEEIVP